MRSSPVSEASEKRSWRSRILASPSQTVILLLIPLMLVELIGITAEGRKRSPSFEGAVMLMGAALALVWNVIAGALMFVSRKLIRRLIQRSRIGRRTTFFLFATALALIEEAVTTTLTNLAPHFGSSQAFVTASRNYLEVVVWHSVIVIAPMFAVWAWLLGKYRFSPAAVFLLFGLNGVLAEFLLGGPALIMAPFWIFVYGLMIFLPAYSFPHGEQAKIPGWGLYPGAVLLCLVASLAAALAVNALAPHLPHFGAELSFPQR